MKSILLISCLFPVLLFGQSKNQKKILAAIQKENQIIFNNLINHIDSIQYYNNHDSLLIYAEQQFINNNLQPISAQGFIETVTKEDGKIIDTSTYLSVNGNKLMLHADFFPFPFSPDRKISGMPSLALREKNQPWFIDYNTISDLKDNTPQSIINAIIREAKRAAAKGATAVFIYNSNNEVQVKFNGKDTNALCPVPVIYITPAASKKYFSDPSDIADIDLNVLTLKKIIYQKSLAGTLNNGSKKTVLIKTYLPNWLNNNPNSADQNFVEAAVLFELMRQLNSEKYKGNNYIFEMNDTLVKRNISYDKSIDYSMIVMNCKFSDYDSALFVYGHKSSPDWPDILSAFTKPGILVKIDSTSNAFNYLPAFATNEHPYLLFSSNNTGNRKPTLTNDVELIRYMLKIIETTTQKEQLVYTAPKKPDEMVMVNDARPFQKDTVAVQKPVQVYKIRVSLGIVIDKSFTGQGLKIKSLIPQKTGAKIGILPGDVLTHMGQNPIYNFNSYLSIIAKYEPGSKAVLRLLRNGNEEEISFSF